MSTVIDLKAYVGSSSERFLVIVDLQEDNWQRLARDDAGGLDRALDNCRAAIRHARENRIPIAFTRTRDQLGPVAGRPQSPWLSGFEPKREDMVFERRQPSCYGNSLFNDVVSRVEGFAICGLAAEEVCLATAIDAAHHGHRVTFLSDASASRQRPHADADAVHSAATSAIELFGDVTTTRHWLVATSPRPVRGRRYG
ncbi:isochorismatase family protein [Bradyrhizobium jicamae]|uniref:Isochorismatase family protein n=1 Tax=Bradyrhizobium jicamae TaxID=280332 RepID=A0ABS5FNI5_9BRAD|nr:isochorismatase family protein [Bradyrhizobium jicamae]MBR0798363.1 isochorismatase family protein [Bradyrhizobium jicamae]MBR0936279.1 isochorismatase family protein [Bradyrhizobium jicamae]